MFLPANEPKSLLWSWPGSDSDCCRKLVHLIISRRVSQHCCKLLTQSLHICSVEHNPPFPEPGSAAQNQQEEARAAHLTPHSLAITAPHPWGPPLDEPWHSWSWAAELWRFQCKVVCCPADFLHKAYQRVTEKRVNTPLCSSLPNNRKAQSADAQLRGHLPDSQIGAAGGPKTEKQ